MSSDKSAGADWCQVMVTTTRTALAEAVFEHFGASAVSVLDADNEPTIELTPDTQPAFRTARVVGLFAADTPTGPITSALGDALGTDAIMQTCPLAAQDWATAWIMHHPPLHFGGRLWVAPHDARVEAHPQAVIIRLDPGLAFGTGTHPTTAMCLSWLAQADLTGCSVLDYGCGSGILAIAAARLGAASVTAVDTDAQAVRATRENAEANNVAACIHTPEIEALGDGAWDIVLANILAGPLVELAPTLTAYTRPGGHLILSGLLGRQTDSIEDAYSAHFAFAEPVRQGDWSRLDGLHKA